MHMLHRKIQSKIRKNETLSACETAVRRGYEQMQIMIQRKEFEANKYFSRTLQAVLLDNPVYQQDSRRLIGRRRFFQGIDGYSEWEPIFFKQDSLQNVTTINLQRGGKISFYPNLCDNLQEIKDEMENTAEFRQYKFRGVYPEPRLHALYSSKVSQHEETEGVANEPDTADHKNGTHSIGYKYHGIRMKAKPLSKLPKIYQLSQKLAEQLGIEHGWNIGADLLAYRDGNDSINWHADDTQQESIVLTLVVAAEGATRTVCVKPKNIPRKGDEQIEMYPIPGDGYQMDGGMQAGYLHGILKQHSTSEQQPQSRRLAIVFRHGKEVMVREDSGIVMNDLSPPNRIIRYHFGPMIHALREGHLYKRTQLFHLNAHQAFRKGVSGNRDQGCDAIVVSRIDTNNKEFDLFWSLGYHAFGFQGGKALLHSFHKKLPVRVFRSSKGKGKFFPMIPSPQSSEGQKEQQSMYRYDGVYQVVNAIVAKSNEDNNNCNIPVDDVDSESCSHDKIIGQSADLFILSRLEPDMARSVGDYNVNSIAFYELLPDIEYNSWNSKDDISKSMFSQQHNEHCEFWMRNFTKKKKNKSKETNEENNK
mmetsp:Transcript_5069/g.7353  ORF Transcript_5069/g.7353 Transcript_5069/m.7353 type:complete len:589 (-) Transcript_5069:81-1847(-)